MTATFDDPEFAARVRARDPDTTRDVVQAFAAQILRAALAAGLARSEAEDVAQATFMTFIQTAPRFEGRSHVRTWLFGILYKKIAEAHRERARNRATEDIDQVFESRFDAAGSWSRPPRPADADVQNREIRERITDCLDAAPPKQRMAFILREVEGFGTQEICKILEVTGTNLGVMLYRVRNRLRECLEAKGIGG